MTADHCQPLSVLFPFRHEMPTDKADPLANQNIRDRFYGQDDPVAAKMMTRQDEMPKLEPPEDEDISSLWLGNMAEHITPEVRMLTIYFARPPAL